MGAKKFIHWRTSTHSFTPTSRMKIWGKSVIDSTILIVLPTNKSKCQAAPLLIYKSNNARIPRPLSIDIPAFFLYENKKRGNAVIKSTYRWEGAESLQVSYCWQTCMLVIIKSIFFSIDCFSLIVINNVVLPTALCTDTLLKLHF